MLFHFSHSNMYVVVIICTSLMITVAKHLFMCLFVTHISSSVKYWFKFFVLLKNWVIFFLCSFENLKEYILDTKLLSDIHFGNIFSVLWLVSSFS